MSSKNKKLKAAKSKVMVGSDFKSQLLNCRLQIRFGLILVRLVQTECYGSIFDLSSDLVSKELLQH